MKYHGYRYDRVYPEVEPDAFDVELYGLIQSVLGGDVVRLRDSSEPHYYENRRLGDGSRKLEPLKPLKSLRPFKPRANKAPAEKRQPPAPRKSVTEQALRIMQEQRDDLEAKGYMPVALNPEQWAPKEKVLAAFVKFEDFN